jgi:hypothetical protein
MKIKRQSPQRQAQASNGENLLVRSRACLACIYHHVPDELARERDIAAGLGVELADVTSGGLIDARIAGSIAAKHPGLNQSPLIGLAFDSLFKQLCAQQTLLTAAGEQVLAPFAFVSNLAGALLALELARFESGQRFRDGKNYLFTSPWAPPHAHMRRYRGRMTELRVLRATDRRSGVGDRLARVGATG